MRYLPLVTNDDRVTACDGAPSAVERTRWENDNMNNRTITNARAAKRAVRELIFSAASLTRPYHCVNRTRWAATTQGRIAVAPAANSIESQAIALDRWENEGGQVRLPDGVATLSLFIKKEQGSPTEQRS